MKPLSAPNEVCCSESDQLAELTRGQSEVTTTRGHGLDWWFGHHGLTIWTQMHECLILSPPLHCRPLRKKVRWKHPLYLLRFSLCLFLVLSESSSSALQPHSFYYWPHIIIHSTFLCWIFLFIFYVWIGLQGDQTSQFQRKSTLIIH